MRNILDRIANIFPFSNRTLVVYHVTDKENLESVRSNGIAGEYTTRETDRIENALERYRPDKYPSRKGSVFAFVNMDIDRIDTREKCVFAFHVSKAPCAAYGVHQDRELMGLSHMLDGDNPPDIDSDSVERTSESFWSGDVFGPIESRDDLDLAERSMFGDITELYFPCDIPPEIIWRMD